MSKLWGGRFSKETNKLVEEFTKSIYYDYKLAKYDILGSQMHILVLQRAGYLQSEEAKKLAEGLEKISQSIDNGSFNFDKGSEDIHTDIQNKLQAQPEIGDLVLKLHTGRSRNEQVVFATKAYCKNELLKNIFLKIRALMKSIIIICEKHKDLIIPGFTHLQHAQPIYLKDYFDAYALMLWKDSNRLLYIKDSIKMSLGAGALAGTPILKESYEFSAKEFVNYLGDLDIEATVNSLEVVSDRDFIIEIISALSIVAMHLSRLSEDLIIWSTKEFDFVEIDDAFCTGSSLMPQKKNPDVLELIRGYAGRVYGNLMSVLTMMKGLPLTYNRDMQLDKEPLFNSFEIVSSELEILKELIETLKFNKKKIDELLKDEALYATDLVYYLIKKGMPFKEAHTKIGELIRHVIQEETEIKNLTEDFLKEKLSPKISKKDILGLFNPKKSVESRASVKGSDFSGLLGNPSLGLN